MIDPVVETLSITLTSCKSTLVHNVSVILIFVLLFQQVLIPTLRPLHMLSTLFGMLFLMVFLDFFQFSVQMTLLIALSHI